MNKRGILFFTILFLFALQLKADYYAPAQNAKTHLWGYINQDGKNITKFKYRLAFNFSYGKAIVLRDKWYYLDKENLKEHVFDDTLQGYFNAYVKRLMVSEKLKYYKDTNYAIVNILRPPEFYPDENEFEDYHLFHFASNSLIQIENIRDEHKLNEENIYSFYHINKGYINELKQIKIISPMVNNRFLGIKGVFNSKKTFNKTDDEIWGVYDTIGNQIHSLDSIKDKIILAMKDSRNYYGCPDESDYSIWAYCMELSPDCLEMYILIALDNEYKPCLELAPFEIRLVHNVSKKSTYYLDMNNPYTISEKVLNECDCRPAKDIEKYDSMMNKWFKRKYSLDSNVVYFDVEFTYQSFYRNEYLYNKNTTKLYSFRRLQNPERIKYGWKYLWGITDGEKILMEPKFELMGVFR